MSLNEEAERRRTLHNEQRKLSATFLNGSGIATVAVGGLAPFVSAVSGATDASPLAVAIIVPLALLSGGGLHWLALRLLEDLK